VEEVESEMVKYVVVQCTVVRMHSCTWGVGSSGTEETVVGYKEVHMGFYSMAGWEVSFGLNTSKLWLLCACYF
jgi:hypothetical protein